MSQNVPTPLDEISEADWAQTPESVKRLVRSLLGRIEQLERQYEELKAENALLPEQVKQNSQNSSKPPSQDVSSWKAKEKKPKGKRGEQFGHEGHPAKLYPVEQCQLLEDYYPKQCIECGAALPGSDPDPYRVQRLEIPPVVPIVHEYRFHALTCGCCGTATRAWDEASLNGSRYGERVVAHVGVLSGQYRQSHRMVQELLRELFGIELSVGSINQLRQESSASVAAAAESAQVYVQAGAHVNIDETSFEQGNTDGKNPKGSKGWLWVMVTPLVSYFAVCLSRSGAVCQQLLGKAFVGIVNSDRFSAYNWLEIKGRQICWAHLKRDFTQIAERSGISGE
jgi:transposase